jgi:hypothetical protein
MEQGNKLTAKWPTPLDVGRLQPSMKEIGRSVTPRPSSGGRGSLTIEGEGGPAGGKVGRPPHLAL